MSGFRSPPRGGNVCHRLELPRLRRQPRRVAEGPGSRKGEWTVPGVRHLHQRLAAAEARRAELEAALDRETQEALAHCDVHRREIAILERRMGELRQQLETREGEIRSRSAQARESSATAGTSPADPRRLALDSVFRANQVLREKIDSLRSGAG